MLGGVGKGEGRELLASHTLYFQPLFLVLLLLLVITYLLTFTYSRR